MNKTIITLEQFAEKIGISRSTAYGWLTEGKLIVGRDVIKIGRVIRIVWDETLLESLLSISERNDEKTQGPVLERKGTGSRSRLAFDADAAEEFITQNTNVFPGLGTASEVKCPHGRNTPGEKEERGFSDE